MLPGRMRVGVIFDAFNVFNRGVETGTYTKITNPNFGLAGSVNAPRYIRLGLRLFF
jgi:hypothetical protein